MVACLCIREKSPFPNVTRLSLTSSPCMTSSKKNRGDPHNGIRKPCKSRRKIHPIRRKTTKRVVTLKVADPEKTRATAAAAEKFASTRSAGSMQRKISPRSQRRNPQKSENYKDRSSALGCTGWRPGWRHQETKTTNYSAPNVDGITKDVETQYSDYGPLCNDDPRPTDGAAQATQRHHRQSRYKQPMESGPAVECLH
ncbi:uncharacterized protein LOC134292013 [Aedes albopictus]|uniref:Secreted protein n=1 Tax=Aedes albopictus TaxID=7160 RepID=A0ABM1YYR5_AEDAL